jgi:hypothetical protein
MSLRRFCTVFYVMATKSRGENPALDLGRNGARRQKLSTLSQ